MIDPIRELRTRAEILQHHLRRRLPDAVSRLRVLAKYRGQANDRILALAPAVRRRECLSIIAMELGFDGWPHTKQVLSGEPAVRDFGTMLYPPRCGGHLNLWYRSHAEAVVGRQECHGYLLG